ncbi:MAG: BatB protein, partial [Pseudomonadota bacterium]|nr:BatB protein [Pseudomonadota bacterium]
MIELLWPWVLLSLPLPWLVRRLVTPAVSPADAIRAPFFHDLAPAAGRRGRAFLPASRAALSLIAWL